MNKLFLWIAAALSVLLLSCEKTDDIRAEIDNLRDRITALEKQVGDVNGNIVALHKLMAESTVIVGVTYTDKDYVLELSDGTKLTIVLGKEIGALVPLMGIDDDGFWIYSLDNGETYVRLTVNGDPVSAWPEAGGTPSPDAEGRTPRLKVDADGYWLVSFDGENYEPLLQNGEKVNAVGGNASVAYSGFFKAVIYDKAKGEFSVELLDGKKLTLPVEDNFGLTVETGGDDVFYLDDTRVFEVVQKGVREAVVKAPAGWKAALDETALTVTSPATARVAEVQAEISVIVTSEKNYIKSSALRVKLLNKKRDAGAAVAWQKFQAGAGDNVLPDYSYAGYKRGEVAPADAWGLGYKVYDVTKYGADKTGKTSSRPALLALLKELKLSGQSDTGSNLANANARAVIYFPAGRYILHDENDNIVDGSSKNQLYKDSKGNNKSVEIQIRGGNFVIKGDGRDKTVLVMDSPNLPDNSEQMWSSPTMINIKNNGSGNTRLTNIAADSPQGAFSVTVGSSAGIGSGDWVWLKLSDNDPVLVAQELAPHVVEGNMTDIQTITVDDYHQVKSVSGNTVTFHEPLLYGVESKWNWELHKFPQYGNVGVEDLAFEGKSKTDFTHHGSWEDDGAYKPLNMMRLTDSWIRRVDFRHVSEAASIVTSANCSAYDITITGNRGHSGVRSQGASRIFIGKVIDRSSGKAVMPPNGSGLGAYMDNAGQYHASGVSNTSLGAVLWNNTWGDDAFFESHSKQPRATLVDRCTGGFVQWRFGGDETNVPNHLGGLTIWNLNATRVAHDFGAGKFQWWLSSDKWWKTLPPVIVGMHGAGPVNFDEDPSQVKYLESNGTAVQPQSLYEAQLRERLGYVPAWLNSLK